MLQDFAKKKFSDYEKLVEFSGGNTSVKAIRNSKLPAFIINFFDCSLNSNINIVSKQEFEVLLNKAIVFNVNYIVKPKNTLIKFLFGDVETKPVEYITQRLSYFQFYGYYVTHIDDFINMNSLDIVSSKQIERIIDDINSKLFDEISDVSNDNSQRLNLIKLLYYFFVDLSENNPINIKLPKKILSVFLADKGFNQIKQRVDGFFSDDIFIQEAIELMNPGTKKPKQKSDVGISEKDVKEIINKAKTRLINKEESNKDVSVVLEEKETVDSLESAIKKMPDVKELREQETKMPAVEPQTLVIDEKIYSDDLLFAAQFESIIPQEKPSGKELRKKLIDDLFCEDSYRKKIVKKIFQKSEVLFLNSVSELLDLTVWTEAIPKIEVLFNKNKVNFFSEEAIKFVDILQSHFTKTSDYSRKQQGT